MKNRRKRVAVQFFGHLRTFDQTHASFLKNIVRANERAGFKVDIFMHTWDEYEARGLSWHSDNNSLKGKKVNNLDIERVKKCYPQLKKIQVSPSIRSNGTSISQANVKSLRENYETEKGVEYDWIIQTRPDILFKNPLSINVFIKTLYHEELTAIGVTPDNVVLCGHRMFYRMNIAHPRLVCEGDMIYFYKPSTNHLSENSIHVPIDYIFERDFKFFRVDDVHVETSSKKICPKKIFLNVLAGFVPFKSIRHKIRQL